MHISEKKAILLPYQEWREEQKQISIFKIFRIKSLHTCIETEHEGLREALFVHHILRIYFFSKYGPHKNMKNLLYLNEDVDGMQAMFHSVVSLNLYKLIQYIIKIIKEKMIILWNKTKRKLAN